MTPETMLIFTRPLFYKTTQSVEFQNLKSVLFWRKAHTNFFNCLIYNCCSLLFLLNSTGVKGKRLIILFIPCYSLFHTAMTPSIINARLLAIWLTRLNIICCFWIWSWIYLVFTYSLCITAQIKSMFLSNDRNTSIGPSLWYKTFKQIILKIIEYKRQFIWCIRFCNLINYTKKHCSTQNVSDCVLHKIFCFIICELPWLLTKGREVITHCILCVKEL